jgi:acetate kinase
LENTTRHGDLDVFAALFLMERHGWSVQDLRRQLAGAGGLAGISGVAGGDVRDIEEAARKGSAAAAVALEAFAYQVRKTIGAYAAAMSGLDAVAFTGGIGENSPSLRARCCAGLEFLGIRIDAARNETGAGDRVVSPAGSPVAVLAIATNEELIVARRAFRILSAKPSPDG